MKHIKPFNDFVNESVLIEKNEWDEAVELMIDILVDSKSKGKFAMYYQGVGDQKNLASKLGLDNDGSRIILRKSDNLNDLKNLKKEYMDKVNKDTKRVFRQYGTGINVDKIENI